jgi:hypothetical protein
MKNEKNENKNQHGMSHVKCNPWKEFDLGAIGSF